MTIHIKCPHCRRALKIKDELSGKKAKCPACRSPFVINPEQEVSPPELGPSDLESRLIESFLLDPPSVEPPAPEPTMLEASRLESPLPASSLLEPPVEPPVPVPPEPVQVDASSRPVMPRPAVLKEPQNVVKKTAIGASRLSIVSIAVPAAGVLFLLLMGYLFFSYGSGKTAKKTSVSKVRETVLLEGAPVADGCRIQFASKEGVLVGLAVVKAGNYVLLNAGAPEIPAGEYLIQILPPAKSKEEEDEEKKQKKAFLLQAAANMRENKPVPETPKLKEEDEIPAMYWTTATSNLKFKVVEGDNTANFELTKKEMQKKS